MKAGDVILIHNMLDPMSWLIRKALHCEYSHVALAVGDLLLVEIVGGGKKIRDIEYYERRKRYKIKVLRRKEEKRGKERKEEKVVLKALNERIRYSHLSFLLAMLDSWKGRPLRRWVCSSFVAYYMFKLGVVISEDKRIDKITPKDFEDCKKLY